MTDNDNDRRSTAVTAVAAVFMSVACMAVLLRCYVRGLVIKAFGWDDGAMVVAMIFYAMFSGCMIGGALYGTGHRFATLTANERMTAMKYWWLCEIAYCFGSIACKISVCIFLMRITVKRVHIWILHTVMALTVITTLVFMFIMLLQCRPIGYFWTRTAFDPTTQGSCISIEVIVVMTYVHSVFAALCDFTVGILPFFIVRKLHMRKKTKIAVLGILSMACIASSAVIIRFPFVSTFKDPDFLYATVEIAIWSNIEVGLGITAGSLATLRPLLRHWLGSTHDLSYTAAAPFPGRSGSRRPGASHERPFPLSSIDDTTHGTLRPDKLALTVTTVHTRNLDMDQDSRWRELGGVNSSEERLTNERKLTKTGTGARTRARSGGERGMGIRQTFEVMQTSTSARSPSIREQV